MMIHSIYTHKEIFLRELISNASDAIDKLYFKSLTDDSVGMNKSDFKITLAVDKDARTLTITDNGIGMTKEEMEEHLGTIANSGSLQFKKENNLAEDNQIIGQFGVGFYSAFMVAKRVTVKSLAFGETQGYVWQSEGVEGYTMDTCDKDTVGTEITLELLDDVAADEDGNGGENYSEFLDQYRIQSLVKRYSDYIRFPICMDMTKSRKKEDSDEYEDYIENVTLNSMVPLWHKNKNEISEEEYNSFYKDKCGDYTDPLCHMHVRNEGTITYDALLYVPSHTPFNYYSKDYEKGLQLYANGVLIMERCEDLLPDYFSFVKGLVDSEDLSLNISREMLQHDAQLRQIARSIERTIKNELQRMMKNDREKYEKFFQSFGLQLKYGIYQDYGMHKDLLQDLLNKKKMILRKYYPTIVLSDIHLGSEHSRTEEVTRFLKHVDCDRLILNGDIIDGWQLKKSGKRWKQKHTDFFKVFVRNSLPGLSVRGICFRLLIRLSASDVCPRQFVQDFLSAVFAYACLPAPVSLPLSDVRCPGYCSGELPCGGGFRLHLTLFAAESSTEKQKDLISI